MIYIPFFIVILIDKRGVREAERGGKIRIQIRIQNTPPAKRGMHPEHSTTQHRAKEVQPQPYTEYTTAQPATAREKEASTHHRTHPATTQRHTPPAHTATTQPPTTPRHTAYTATHTAYKNAHTGVHTRTGVHPRAHRRTQAHTGAHRRTGTHGGVQARSG